MTAAYDRYGEGPALILVHGIGSSRRVFDPVVDLLATDHEVVAVDLPGFGESPVLSGARTDPEGYSEWLAGFVADLGLERPHVAGNSLGGAIALEAARQGWASAATAFSPIGFWSRAGRLWCQGLVGTAHAVLRTARPVVPYTVAPFPVRTALLATMIGRPWRVRAPEAAHALESLALQGAFAATLETFGEYTWTESTELGYLPNTPVTVAWGTRDVLLPRRTQAGRAAALLPTARHVALRGCGHVPFGDDPEQCVRVMRPTEEENS